MEFSIPQFFSKSETGAPALNRGLAILAALGDSAPLSLDNLSTALDLPKASVFRLLNTLITIGLIRKTADKRYEALWRLNPVGDPKTLFRQSIKMKMQALCEVTGCTVEWYESCAEGMRLTLQKNPEGEVCVKAQPGFLRGWAVEFEAVARLGAAFSKKAPEILTTRAYVSNGILESLNTTTINLQLEDARKTRAAYDSVYNTNGVRRAAVATFDSAKQFIGILAIAEVYHFKHRDRVKNFIKQIKTSGQTKKFFQILP